MKLHKEKNINMIDDKTKVNEEVDFTGGKEPLSDQLVGGGEKPELSPNPLFSGYEHQVTYKVDLSIQDDQTGMVPTIPFGYIDYSTGDYADPDSEAEAQEFLPILPHTLFVFEFYDGEGKVADRKYYTVLNPKGSGVELPEESLVEVYPDQPAVDARELHEYPKPVFKKGFSGTPVHENQAPKKRPQIFSDPVNFLEDVFIKGKPLKDYIDSQGGVTEEELQAALEPYLKKTEGARVWAINDFVDNNVYDFNNLPKDIKVGDFIKDDSYPFFGVVVYIDYTHKVINLWGTDDTYGADSYGWVFANGEWTMNVPKKGTKLYQHRIELAEDVYLKFLSCISTPINTVDILTNEFDRGVNFYFVDEVEGEVGTVFFLSTLNNGIVFNAYSSIEDDFKQFTYQSIVSDTVEAYE